MYPEYGQEPVPLSQRLSPNVTMAEKPEATDGRGSSRLRSAAWEAANKDRVVSNALNIIILLFTESSVKTAMRKCEAR